MGHHSTLAIIHNSRGKVRSLIELWKCVWDVSQVQGLKHGWSGFLGQSFAITQVGILSLRILSLKLCIADPSKLLYYVPRTTKVEPVERELIARDQVLKEVCERILRAQVRMKKAYDSYHQECEFSIRGWVFFMLRPYKQMSLVKWKNFKLSPRYYGPVKVLDKIGKVAYKLDLPITFRLYSVFHVSVLKNQIGENHIVLRELPG